MLTFVSILFPFHAFCQQDDERGLPTLNMTESAILLGQNDSLPDFGKTKLYLLAVDEPLLWVLTFFVSTGAALCGLPG